MTNKHRKVWKVIFQKLFSRNKHGRSPKKKKKTTTLFTGFALHSTIKCSNSNGDIEIPLWFMDGLTKTRNLVLIYEN